MANKGFIKLIARAGRNAALQAGADFPFQDVVEVLRSDVPAFNEAYKGWHYHEEDEVRFFDRGGGAFFVVTGAAPPSFGNGLGVRVVECFEGAYVLILAGTWHRFRSGDRGFRARRFFRTEGGGAPLTAPKGGS